MVEIALLFFLRLIKTDDIVTIERLCKNLWRRKIVSWWPCDMDTYFHTYILYLVIFLKFYSCVSLIISNSFLAAVQSKHWVKNLSLYNLIILSLHNLMAAKMIDVNEWYSFCPSYPVIMELDTKKRSRNKICTWEWLLKQSKRIIKEF